jgi:hypothetical protein
VHLVLGSDGCALLLLNPRLSRSLHTLDPLHRGLPLLVFFAGILQPLLPLLVCALASQLVFVIRALFVLLRLGLQVFLALLPCLGIAL